MLRNGLVRLGLFLFLGSIGVAATPDDERSPAVSFDKFPLPIKRFHMFASAGTPVPKAKEMNGPFPDDFPPATVVFFEDLRRYPSLEKGPRYMMTAKNVLRVYNISAIKSAPYETIQYHIDELRKLLKARPAIVHESETPSENEHSLPDYPPRNAGHLIEVKCSYIDAAWGSGLLYVTRFVQGVGEWPDNEQLVYLLQGLSKDDRFYISADFRVTHPALENAKPRSGSNDDSEKLTARLASIMLKDRDDSFTPSLRSIRNWLLTLKIE